MEPSVPLSNRLGSGALKSRKASFPELFTAQRLEVSFQVSSSKAAIMKGTPVDYLLIPPLPGPLPLPRAPDNHTLHLAALPTT